MNEKFTMFKSYYIAAKNFSEGRRDSDKVFGRLMRILCEYAIENTADVENFSKTDRLFFDLIQPNVDSSLEINKTNKARQEKAVNARLQKKSSSDVEAVQENASDTEKQIENAIENSLELLDSKCNVENLSESTKTENAKPKREKPKRKTFVPPTLEEIEAYCKEKNLSVDPAKFFDYYTSKGWKIGGVSMVDWQATLRNWERREKNGEFSNNRVNNKKDVVTAFDKEEGYSNVQWDIREVYTDDLDVEENVEGVEQNADCLQFV